MSHSTISILPEHIVDQIKAGEVIERPASLIKELVENSIDAGASHLQLNIQELGLSSFSIIDDGEGMSFEDLPLAFCRHATSKISQFGDLYALQSYGFRGEALASIASVSKLTCTSYKSLKDFPGGKIVFHGGKLIKHIPLTKTDKDKGTKILVEDLFYNTPARLKFIRSKQSEKNAIQKMTYALIMANYRRHFTLTLDSAPTKIYATSNTETSCLKRFMDLANIKESDKNQIQHVQLSYEGHSLEGYVTINSDSKRTGKVQYTFCNGRYFINQKLTYRLTSLMESIWGHRKTGHYALFYTVPKDQVDNNVHPQKTEIKFFKENIVFSLTTEGLKKAISNQKIQENDINPKREFSLNSSSSFEESPRNFSSNFVKEDQQVASHRFFSIDQEHCLYQFPNSPQTYLIHFPKMLGAFIWKKFNLNKTLDEGHITPLLISEPYQYNENLNETFFNHMKDKGLEFKRLNSDVILLKSIPSYLETFPLNGIIPHILHVLNQKDQSKDSFINAGFNLVAELNYIEKILSKEEISFYIENRVLTPISTSKLSSMLTENEYQ
jgi:DNA mismatch repair protein MutL